MPSQVYEETIELTIGLLEAEAPDSSRPELFAPSYPYPRLSATGKTERRTFRLLVLENEFLSAGFLPELGGRLAVLLDKRMGTQILSASEAGCVAGGPRGIELPLGLQLRLDRRHDRRNSLGLVEAQLVPGDEGEGSAIWFFEIDQGSGLTTHWRFTLPPQRAELIVEVRGFNRMHTALPYDPSLSCRIDGEAYLWPLEGAAVYNPKARAGLAFWPITEPLDSAAYEGRLAVCRFARGLHKLLAPRQLDVWQLRVQPLSGLEGLTGASTEAAIHLGMSLQIQSVERRTGHKLLVLDPNSQALESPIELHPEHLEDIELPFAPSGVAILDAAKQTILKFELPLERLTEWSAVVADAHPPAELPTGLPDVALRRACFEVALRAQAHLQLGLRRLADGKPEQADSELESSLLYNAEDHLAWWAKAMAARLSGQGDDERAELLNAHYLAPLEPALRAEGFLSQPQTAEKQASALLKPLDDAPEHFIEIACLLIECGQMSDAARWIDEALRHADLQMLRYLLAWCHLKETGMAFEVARELKAASDKPLTPPYPWRPIELQALGDLSKAFPDDDRLRQVLKLTSLLAPAPGHKS